MAALENFRATDTEGIPGRGWRGLGTVPTIHVEDPYSPLATSRDGDVFAYDNR